VSDRTQSGAAAGAGPGGTGGFFFFGFAALLALACLSVPRASRILRAFALPQVAAPCLLLPERPG
jgi:hypothetical protein